MEGRGEVCLWRTVPLFHLLMVFDLSSLAEASSVAHKVSSHTDSVLRHCCMPCVFKWHVSKYSPPCPP